jgi:hypothetical protein
MEPLLVLGVVVFLGLVYVLIPVGLAARGYFRHQKLVRCPLLGLGAGVRIDRAGLAEALGRRSLRHVAGCTYWPRRKHCAQGCRMAPDEDFHEFRLPVV